MPLCDCLSALLVTCSSTRGSYKYITSALFYLSAGDCLSIRRDIQHTCTLKTDTFFFLTAAIFFMSSAGSVMLQAFGVATAAVAAHGAMRVPDDLFIDDANTDGGFFSFLQPPRAGITGSAA